VIRPAECRRAQKPRQQLQLETLAHRSRSLSEPARAAGKRDVGQKLKDEPVHRDYRAGQVMNRTLCVRERGDQRQAGAN